MRGNTSSGYGQERTIWLIVGVIVFALIGIGLLWLGFTLGKESGGPAAAVPTATATPMGPLPTVAALVPTSGPPTATPLPAATAAPTPVPDPMIVAQEGGVNLRSGPGTDFAKVGRLEENATARITGRYGDWWQVDYGGTPAWVANWVVASSNTDGVPEVVPPPSPIPATPIPPTATPIPATATPAATPTPDNRGLKVNEFEVGHKVSDKNDVNPSSGPFGNAGDIWFCFDVSNQSGGGMTLKSTGAFVQESGDYQISWGADGNFGVANGQKIGGSKWCDHFYNDKVDMGAGTYHIWLRICFPDGSCINASGPAEVKIG
jgi:hypothetical protein